MELSQSNLIVGQDSMAASEFCYVFMFLVLAQFGSDAATATCMVFSPHKERLACLDRIPA